VCIHTHVYIYIPRHSNKLDKSARYQRFTLELASTEKYLHSWLYNLTEGTRHSFVQLLNEQSFATTLVIQ